MDREELPINPERDKITCPLCHRYVTIKRFDEHYDRCLDISYLMIVSAAKGDPWSREELEAYNQASIDRLLEKYPPEEFNKGNIFKKNE